MKREFIKNLLPDINDDTLNAIMAEVGKDIEAKNGTITALTTEKEGLKAQLDSANEEIQSYKDMDVDGIKASAQRWEQKYNADTKTLQEQLESERYAAIVKDAVSKIKFSSESAKKAFIADLTEKKLQAQDGKLLGLDDFEKMYRESDPGAFSPEEDTTPTFVRGGSGGTASGGFMDKMMSAMGIENKKE